VPASTRDTHHSPHLTAAHHSAVTRRSHFKQGLVTSLNNWDPQRRTAGCHVKHSANKQFTVPFKYANETCKKPSRLVWLGLLVILDWVNASDNWQLLHTHTHTHTRTHTLIYENNTNSTTGHFDVHCCDNMYAFTDGAPYSHFLRKTFTGNMFPWIIIFIIFPRKDVSRKDVSQKTCMKLILI